MHRAFSILSVVVLLGSAAVGEAEARKMSAVYAHDVLSMTVPFEATRSGEAELRLEVLNPEDRVLGRSIEKERLQPGSAAWKTEIRLGEAMPPAELIWQRVRFTLHYADDAAPADEEIRSISSILERPVMHILAQKSYIAGAPAAMRIIVSSAANSETTGTIREGTVRIELNLPDRKPRLLFNGRLDRRGSADAEFRFPSGMTGSFPVHLTADTALGKVESIETVELEDQIAVLLTSEKPMYQPSQTMHLRALALNRADHHAAAGRELTFEVEDSRGNKVFRKGATTDNFGVASAEFTLADEVNLGAYHIRTKLGDATSTAAELTVNVARYVLPRFRVTIDFDKKDGKQRRDYRPGDHVRGLVKASYFFGKPVDGATVTLKASAMDVELFQAATGEGRTDRDGTYHFDLALPRFFTGRPDHHGSAPVVVEATVKDSAEHAETRGEPITVSKSPLLITAIPEGGELVRGVSNEVYLLASYPDGTPARVDLAVRVRGKATGDDALDKVRTNESGIATVRMPADGVNTTLRIEADDRKGNHASETLQLESRDGEDQVLARTSHAVYKPGDAMTITVLSTRQRGAAYVDLVRNGQTILTRDADMKNGRAELDLTVTPEMSGTLMVNAYVIGRDGREIADQRLVYVQPADELHVEAKADAASYLPGSEARVNFRVTNQKGEGVSAALGLEVVDQAVFALAEKQPGFAKVFFYLEQELMKPRYEIHSLEPGEIVEPSEESAVEQHDLAARVLFAAASPVTPLTLNSETGRALPDARAADYRARYQKSLVDYARSLAAKMTNVRHERDVPAAFRALKDDDGRSPRDAWGTELIIEPAAWSTRNNRWYAVRSAGPDREFDTADDFLVWLEPRSLSALIDAPERMKPDRREDSITLRMEHDRGTNNGLAEIAGTVSDVTGAVIPGAHIHILRTEDGGWREAVSNVAGTFSFTALPAGRYRVRVEALGFWASIRTISIAARDRADLTVKLSVGAATETVTVQAEAMVLNTESAEVSGRAFPAAAPKAKASGESAVDLLDRKDEMAGSGAAVAPAGHIRSYFPEALYINPEILTDGNGRASVQIPLADSITTWRMAMFASTAKGALGTGNSELKVFQDFFVDLDLPVTLTQGDKVSIPVAVYNYSGCRGEVNLKLQQEDWFVLQGAGDQSVSIDSGQVGAAQFTIEAKRIGKFRLTLTGIMSGESRREDTVVREIEVVPNGEPKDTVFNGRLEASQHHTIRFPDSAIPDAGKIYVRLYPGPLSQLIEGMDAILRMPFGCFEQTSSSTYPNVLALDYMKRTKKLTPEVHAKAEAFIATGYQRLLTFEVPGGGFSWFGNAPANKILTAYGLMEFHDMAQVHDVDARLIERTRDWLVQQQLPDGSWKPDTQFINEGATDRFNTDLLRITAYIALALEIAEYKGDAIENARRFIEEHLDDSVDAYTLAVIANFAVENEKDSKLAQRALAMLRDTATQKEELAWWTTKETSVYATGDSAAVETTGLAVQAMLKAGASSAIVRKALAWITSRKGGDGNWGSTQATIVALRALVLASEQSGANAHGTVDVLLNGAKVASLDVNKDNNDLLHQFVLAGVAERGDNEVELRFLGEEGMAYQVAGRYFVPWRADGEDEPLAIDVRYDRTRLAQDEIVTGTATIRNNTGNSAKMVMVDLGIPPGFELLSEDLQNLVARTVDAKSGRLEKFNMTATQAILYFDSIAPKDSFEVRFRLRAKYPIRVNGFASRVYEYYNPSLNATSKPAQFEVTARARQ